MTSQICRIAIFALALAATSCTDSVRQGTGSSFLIVNRLEGASGATPQQFGGTLISDVLTLVDRGTPRERLVVFNDVGRVSFSVGEKDPGRGTAPTQNLAITVNRYRVRYIRADGRNTPGVDVPYPFDSALTVTVPLASQVSAGFELVRHIAKEEAPLRALATNGVLISTIAEVTFYGQDQTGHEVTATARIGIDFGNYADPD